MKATFSFLFSLIAVSVIAQVCRPGQTELDVRFGAYSNTLRTGGDLFFDGANARMGVVNEDKSITSLLFGGGVWLAGKVPSGELRMAGVTYRSNTDNFDFYPGPLDQFGQTREDDCKKWDKIFSITKKDIKVAIDLIYQGQLVPSSGNCDALPFSVRSWPAKGNPYFEQYYGFELPDQELASFFDYDMDGKYDPCKGDLPTLALENCDYYSVYEALESFPSQLHFNIFNDNGGSHRLSAGEAIKMEVHSYFYTFDSKEGEDMSFLKFKTLYKGDVPLDSFYFSLWLDPDLGCYEDDYIGTASHEDLVFIYNEDFIDGSNGSPCAGGTLSFEDKIPMLGVAYMQGLKNNAGDNTGLTSSWMTENCSIGNPTLPCDPEGMDSSFYYGMKWNGYYFDGNPAIPTDTTMCSYGIGVGDRRVLMSTGGVSILPGDTKEVVIAITVAKNVPHPCPDSKYIIEKNKQAKSFYDRCWQNIDGPDAPQVTATTQDSKIKLKLNNNLPGHNNKDLSYEVLIKKLFGQNNNKYKFEGYKVYQVNTHDYDLNKLGDSNSVEIFTFDLANTIDSVFNWETVIEDNGKRKLVKILKAVGTNSGVPSEFDIEYDYLDESPLLVNKEYHYVVIAYGYNNYENYNATTNAGQATQYISSLQNAEVITIKPKYDNSSLCPKIKRISGRGNYNFLEITDATRENMLSTSFNGTIEYLAEKGPFDIKILDSTKVIGKKFRIEINGPIDNSSKVCDFKADETYYTVTDIETGISYKSQHPLSNSFDESFDAIGIAISIFQPKEPGVDNGLSNGYVGEKLMYKDESKIKWFATLSDTPYSYNLIDYAKDPIEISADKDANVPLITSGSFYPFYYSKYALNDGRPFVTATSLEAMPIAIDYPSGTLKLKDLNNVDIVFTSDKSKWSRCIVVETANSFFAPLGLSDTKSLEVKSNASVDKDGNVEATSTGFSWFPGYAVDVETGQRLNIFFGENTILAKNPFSLKNPSIADDMLFNPSDELVSTHNFTGQDSFLLNFPVGGGHYIYVTRQAYDECVQLATRLRQGSSSFSKRDPIGAITWAAIPVLKNKSKLMSYAEGIIPNDLTIMLRVNNSFFNATKNADIATFKQCLYENEYPVYEIECDLKSGIVDYTQDPSWRFKSSFSGFTIDALDEDLDVLVSDASGKIIANHKLAASNEMEWRAADKGINNSMIIVKITSKKSGVSKAYKTVMIW